jgi:hypothetical protein
MFNEKHAERMAKLYAAVVFGLVTLGGAALGKFLAYATAHAMRLGYL